jgi:hypothetical protein
MSAGTRSIIVVVVVAVAAAVIAAVVLLEGGDGVGGNWTIEDARAFDEYPVYWLGEEFDGLPLTNISYTHRENTVFFAYGDCEPPKDGGCAPPLEIIIEPCRQNPPGRYATSLDSLVEIRGAKAALQREFVLWTGEVAVTIFAERELAVEAANALVSVRDGPEAAAKPLEPPGRPCF